MLELAKKLSVSSKLQSGFFFTEYISANQKKNLTRYIYTAQLDTVTSLPCFILSPDDTALRKEAERRAEKKQDTSLTSSSSSDRSS